jgi:predicted LPLAT superfamily acyltransferase
MTSPETATPPSPQAEWAQRPERSNQTLLRLMTWMSLHLGRAPARFVLAGASLYFLLFAPAANAASRAYLRRARSRAPTFADLFRHFHSFATTIHDRVFLLNARFDLFQVEKCWPPAKVHS